MRLYLDQMLRVDLAELLRSAGHDVLWPAEVGQSSADDAEMLGQAIDTTDRLEGEYIRRYLAGVRDHERPMASVRNEAVQLGPVKRSTR
jgi:uncharacterized protein with PIN domain